MINNLETVAQHMHFLWITTLSAARLNMRMTRTTKMYGPTLTTRKESKT